MHRRVRAACEVTRDFLRSERGAALIALTKSIALLAVLSELGWLMNVHYFSRVFPQLPISVAWSMLTMIFLIAAAQLSGSVAMKLWGIRQARLRASLTMRMTSLLCSYLAGDAADRDIEAAAREAPSAFEAAVADALLRLRGSSIQRLRELPVVEALRDRWTRRLRSAGDEQRRILVERLSLLRDVAAIPALERSLEDPSAQVVAAAVRGLLRMPSYAGRDDLLRSLPGRGYLVRVLTASESPRRRERVQPLDPARAHCAVLARRGVRGIDRLRSLSAQGKAGEAPAEALSASLVASARGGR